MGTPCIICHHDDQKHLVLNGLRLICCKRCGLIRREAFDMPIAYYEALDAGNAPEKRAARFRNSLDRIKLFSRFVSLSDWCDVGTGEGIFLEALAASGGRGIGIEPSEKGRAEAQRHNVKIVGRTIEAIDHVVKSERVRTVSLFHVIEHLEHPDVEIRRIYEALPSGGFLILETPNIDSPLFRAKGYHDQLINPEHLWYFSEKTLRALVEKQGFTVVASGKRDFDQRYLTIKESLRRLGLLPWLRTKSVSDIDIPTQTQGDHMRPRENPFRFLLRRVLSAMVVMSGRSQFVWFVARK